MATTVVDEERIKSLVDAIFGNPVQPDADDEVTREFLDDIGLTVQSVLPEGVLFVKCVSHCPWFRGHTHYIKVPPDSTRKELRDLANVLCVQKGAV